MTNAHASYLPTLVGLFFMQNENSSQFYANLAMPDTAVLLNGAPKTVWVRITVPMVIDELAIEQSDISIPDNSSIVDINVVWQNKTSTRLAGNLTREN